MKLLTIAVVFLLLWCGILTGLCVALYDQNGAAAGIILQQERSIDSLTANLKQEDKNVRTLAGREKQDRKALVALIDALKDAAKDVSPSSFDGHMNSTR